MVGIVSAMKVAIPPTAKMATRITHMISVSPACSFLFCNILPSFLFYQVFCFVSAVFCFVIFYQVQPISLSEGGLLHYWLITDWLAAAVSLSTFNQVERDSFSLFFLALQAQDSSISGILVTTSRNHGITSRNREAQFDFGTQERCWTLVTF